MHLFQVNTRIRHSRPFNIIIKTIQKEQTWIITRTYAFLIFRIKSCKSVLFDAIWINYCKWEPSVTISPPVYKMKIYCSICIVFAHLNSGLVKCWHKWAYRECERKRGPSSSSSSSTIVRTYHILLTINKSNDVLLAIFVTVLSIWCILNETTRIYRVPQTQ